MRAAQALDCLSQPQDGPLASGPEWEGEGCRLARPVQWSEEGWSLSCSVYPEQLLWTIDMEK